MSIYAELSYDRVVSSIKAIQFCILSEDEIRRRSACEVTQNQTFVGNEPVVGGLFDTRMGVIDNRGTCATCRQRNNFCPGHFGHITMARPVFHIHFFDTVRKVLKCVCYRCSRLLIDLESPEAKAILARKTTNQRRWDAMIKLCQKQKVRRCGGQDGCGAKQPDQYQRTDDMRVRLVWKELTAAAEAAQQSAAAAEQAAAAAADEEDVEDFDDDVEEEDEEDNQENAEVSQDEEEDDVDELEPIPEGDEGAVDEDNKKGGASSKVVKSSSNKKKEATIAMTGVTGLTGGATSKESVRKALAALELKAKEGTSANQFGGQIITSSSSSNQREITLSAEDVLTILKRVTDADAAAIGLDPRFNRPEWMICSVLLVPPPAVRPSVRHDTGQRQEDDLTHMLSDIVKYNNQVRDAINKGSPAKTVDHLVLMLQWHAAMLIDKAPVRSIHPSTDKSGRVLRSLTERLKHKDGRIRGNLLGKRVDFSARTVITPDPNLSIDELGVPLRIAMNLTFPEVVNKHNRDRLQRLVLTGPDVYPGAKHVRKTAQGNRTIRLRNHPDPASILLEDGDVVERHLLDGDYVLFNRQPSLHKMSMMGHRVKVMDYNTFRLNVCVCACYNADFDGDEMNMHVPQSLQTHYELKMLAAVPLHILSPRYSKPIITIVQDVALGVFRVTQGDVRVSQAQLFNLVASNPLLDPLLLPAPVEAPTEDERGVKLTAAQRVEKARWSGRQLLSTVLPPAIAVRMGNKDKDDDGYVADDDEIVIEGGKILSGVLSTKTFTKESRGLVHAVYNTLGPAAVTAMLNNTQKLICDYLVLSGFSVGISDLIVPAANVDPMNDHLITAKRNVYELLQKVHQGSFENMSTKSDADYLEDKIQELLSDGVKKAEKAATIGLNTANNRVLNMINSGSKGKQLNVQQMLVCVAQQSIEQKRVPDGFDHRTLPHFTKYDDGPEARGFVEHSFMEGLAPHEFFFHSMAGRIGLIDTAVRTSETGYIQRRLVKAMEDCKIQHDLTVRNANGQIVQFLYGEDGMDAIKLEHQKLPYMTTPPAAMRKSFLLTSAEELKGHVRPDLYEKLSKTEDEWRPRLEEHFKTVLEDRRKVIMHPAINKGQEVDVPIVYPVHVQRIVDNAADLSRQMGCIDGLVDLDPIEVLDTLDGLVKQLQLGIMISDEESEEQRKKKTSLGVTWMPVLLRAFLSPKVLIIKHRINRVAFQHIVKQVRHAFVDAMAAPSEMVGVLSATSIGEPISQLSADGRSTIRVRHTRRHTDGSTVNMYVGPIGPFIDNMMDSYPDRMIQLHEDSFVLDLNDATDKVEILGVSESEKTSWKPISQVSKHMARGGMVTILTQSGRTTTATLSHSFLTRAEHGVVPILGSDLKIGDRVPVAKSIPIVCDPVTTIKIGDTDYSLDQDLGWFFGLYLADGCVNKTSIIIAKINVDVRTKLTSIADRIFGRSTTTAFRFPAEGTTIMGYDASEYEQCHTTFSHTSLAQFLKPWGRAHEKRVAPWMFEATKPFIAGLIAGYFDGDGNASADYTRPSIRIGSTSEAMIDDFMVLMAYVGIFSSKDKEDREGRRVMHVLSIPNKQTTNFLDTVGCVTRYKRQLAELNVIYGCAWKRNRINEEDIILPRITATIRKGDEDFIEVIERANRSVRPESSDATVKDPEALVHQREVKYDKEEIDAIPALGDVLAFIGKELAMDGQSRLYGRQSNKAAIGRRTLQKYFERFEARVQQLKTRLHNHAADAAQKSRNLRAILQHTNQTYRGGCFCIPISPQLEEAMLDIINDLPELGDRTQFKDPISSRKDHVDVQVIHNLLLEQFLSGRETRLELKTTLDDVEPKMAILRRALDAEVVWDPIVKLDYSEDPKEFVYDFTVPGNDTFMIDTGVFVHNTLNSVEYNTDLMLRVNGSLEAVKIGPFVDEHIQNLVNNGDAALEQHENDTWLGWIKDGRYIEVLSCDEHGHVDWHKVEAVTKHPVVNPDGSNTILEVTLESGRQVTATKARSFLVRSHNVIKEIYGDDLRVGDSLPVSRIMPVTASTQTINVADYLSKKEYYHGDEVHAAMDLYQTNPPKSQQRTLWYQTHRDSSFILPDMTPTTFASRFVNNLNVRKEFVKGRVSTSITKNSIPSQFVLDTQTGYFIGAFVAVGVMNDTPSGPTGITMSRALDDSRRTHFQEIAKFCQEQGFTLSEPSQKGDIRISNAVLARFFERLFGRTLDERTIPAFLLTTPDDFLKGFVRGMIGAKGFDSQCATHIPLYVRSRYMAHMIQQILLRFDVMTSITTSSSGFMINIRAGNARRFAAAFSPILMTSIQDKLNTLLNDEIEVTYNYGRGDVVPSIQFYDPTLDGVEMPLDFTVHRDALSALKKRLAGDDVNLQVLDAIDNESVLYDRILEIKEVVSDHPYVYDLTVEHTRNFNTFQGIAMKDTFHSAGAAAATTVTSGVPRMRELLGVSKNIKTPEMRICLRTDWANSMERADQVRSTMQTTFFRDLLSKSAIYNDPDDEHTSVGEDAELMKYYYEFSKALRDGGDPNGVLGDGCDPMAAPLLLRFELDRKKMLDLQVTMLDVECVLMDFYNDVISCVLSDDNADKLICRIRLNLSSSASGGGSSGGGNKASFEDLLTEIKAFEQSLIENLVIKGIEKIEKAVLVPPAKLKRYDSTTDTFEPDTEWSIITLGSNILDVLCNENVDATRTTTNDVFETYQTLGIEAARSVLIHELRLVLGDLALDHRHLSLLADTMSNRGFLMTIDRHGINHRGELGPLAKCSFEQTDAMLIKAGIFSECDNVKGVSANIMLGQIAPCGTGECEVLLDNEMYVKMAAPLPLDVIVPPNGNRGAPGAAAAQPASPAGQQQQQQQRQPRPDAAPVTMLDVAPQEDGAAASSSGMAGMTGKKRKKGDDNKEGEDADADAAPPPESMLMDADDIVIV